MSLTKHAAFEVIAAQYATQGGPLMRTAHRAEFEYEPREGFLYVRSRAISSRCNDNFDEFPAEEIKAAHKTFIGKPVFVNHHNANHRRARGVIIAVALHEDVTHDQPDTWAEVLMEVDARSFPKLAEAIVKGHIARTSMGTDVAYSVCSFCGNKAASPVEYCDHIPRLKGQRIYRTTASGVKEGILVREICYGLGFFENSLLVEDPADPTAAVTGVDTRGVQGIMATASRRTASFPPIPETSGRFKGVGLGEDEDGYFVQTHRARSKSYPTKEAIPDKDIAFIESTGSRRTAISFDGDGPDPMPAKVDTLRREQCPVCSEVDSYDGEECRVCGFITPPAEFGDPDLGRAKEVDASEDKDGEALQCDSCEATFSGRARVAVVLNKDRGVENPDEDDFELVEGDICPDCDDGTLKTKKKSTPKTASDDDDDDTEDDDFEPAADEDSDEDDPDDEDDDEFLDAEPEGDGDEDDDDSTKESSRHKAPTAARHGSNRRMRVDMRPALAALAAQQKQIDALNTMVGVIARSAGIANHPRMARLMRVASGENPANSGWAIDPIGTEAPAATTDEASTPTATDNPEAIGASELTDTAPLDTTDVEAIGGVVDSPLDLNQEDVTKQVAGTDDLGTGPVGQAGSGRTETEVRVGTPDETPAFDNGDFKEARTIASLRLARLRIEAGIATGDDLDLGTAISASKASAKEISMEIQTLASVVAARSAATPQRERVSRRLVPQAPAGSRTATRAMPSLAGLQPTATVHTAVAHTASGISDSEILFE